MKDKICPRCGKHFIAHPNAKYCSECLKWLAYHADTSIERARYTRNFNTRRDCKGYIEIRKPIFIFGKEYQSIREICKTFDINEGQYYYYKKHKGYTPEKIIKIFKLKKIIESFK